VNYTNPVLLYGRHIARSLGILTPLARVYRRIFAADYENRFDSMMMDTIAPGDIVWDVGANVGFYSTKFSEAVAPNGSVVAFEPAQSTIAILERACAGHPNISCKNVALSDNSSDRWFRDSRIEGDPCNGLTDRESPNAIRISVRSGDDMVAGEPDLFPNAIKIDVEGFEAEVIAGLTHRVLPDPRLTRMFVEVHFHELNKRGLPNAPQDIVKTIESFGFKVRWADPSHIIATR
jgi:FkbM family methyltransferase